MRLFELKGKHGRPPTRAGVAALEWSDDVELPRRDGSTIVIPTQRVEFFPLQKGRQFLVQAWRIGSTYGHHIPHLYFGGTAEAPFLVEIQPRVLTALQEGEDGFYQALKPGVVSDLERRFSSSTVRQGDWFAVPTPTDMGTKLLLDLALELGKERLLTLKTLDREEGVSLGGTRHTICSGWVGLGTQFPGRAVNVTFAEGVLKAPDHEARVLSGPHALFQTAHLVRPQEAD